MTDTELLEQLIKESGLKKKAIAKELDLSPFGFARKVNNESDFTVPEMDTLCKILNIKSQQMKQRVFFKPKVDETSI